MNKFHNALISCRVEIVDIRSPRGIAKILGTLLSVIGVIVIAFYKGPAVPSLQGDAPVHVGTKSVHENWLKGSLLTVSSCILWSILFIMQVFNPFKKLSDSSLFQLV